MILLRNSNASNPEKKNFPHPRMVKMAAARWRESMLINLSDLFLVLKIVFVFKL